MPCACGLANARSLPLYRYTQNQLSRIAETEWLVLSATQCSVINDQPDVLADRRPPATATDCLRDESLVPRHQHVNSWRRVWDCGRVPALVSAFSQRQGGGF